MEFLEYLVALCVLYLVIFKPEKESLAFKFLWFCIVADIILWLVASAFSWVPGLNL